MGFESTQALLVEQLREVRSAERRLVQALQALARGVAALGDAATPGRYAFAGAESTGETLNLLGLAEVTRLFEDSLAAEPKGDRLRPSGRGMEIDPQMLLDCGGALG